jgi:hypothetical protein
MSDWQENIVRDAAGIDVIIAETKRIAVLGIKTGAQAGQPAIEVPRYMAENGYEIVPVPVYFPEATEILGAKVYRKVADVPGEIDMVNVFRRSNDVAAHVDDILAAKPKFVWMQLGIANPEAAETFARAGIRVVQNRCLLVDHASFARRR